MTNEQILDVISRAKYENGLCINVEQMHKFTGKEYIITINPIWNFCDYYYRIIEEPKMIPLDFTDILDIMGKWLVDGRSKKECFVGIYDSFDKLICIKYEGDYANLSFQDLQKYFTFRDTGKRLEKEKK